MRKCVGLQITLMLLFATTSLMSTEQIGYQGNFIPIPGFHGKMARSNPNSRAENEIENVPAYSWSYGCNPTAGAMLIGYYDRNGYPDLWDNIATVTLPCYEFITSTWISNFSEW